MQQVRSHTNTHTQAVASIFSPCFQIFQHAQLDPCVLPYPLLERWMGLQAIRQNMSLSRPKAPSRADAGLSFNVQLNRSTSFTSTSLSDSKPSPQYSPGASPDSMSWVSPTLTLHAAVPIYLERTSGADFVFNFIEEFCATSATQRRKRQRIQ